MDSIVTVILCTYNGEKYVIDQLQSIFNQTYSSFRLVVFDDCSTDKTVEYLQEYKETNTIDDEHFIIHINNEPSGSAQNNFLNAIKKYRDASYIALSDQDDIWLPNKLEIMMKTMTANEKEDQPCLVCHSAETIDKEGNQTGRNHISPIDFYHAILHPIAQGCCMLFNKECTDLIDFNITNMYMHDWYISLLYLLENEIITIDEPLLKYRQHDNNVVGRKKIGLFSRLLNFIRNEEKVNHYTGIIKMLYSISMIRENEFLRSFYKCYKCRDSKGIIGIMNKYHCFDKGIHGLLQQHIMYLAANRINES